MNKATHPTTDIMRPCIERVSRNIEMFQEDMKKRSSSYCSDTWKKLDAFPIHYSYEVRMKHKGVNIAGKWYAERLYFYNCGSIASNLLYIDGYDATPDPIALKLFGPLVQHLQREEEEKHRKRNRRRRA